VVYPVFLSIDFVADVSKGLEVWPSVSVCQCPVSKPHGEGFELFFNVLVYPFLLFRTQTLEIRERSRR
jgi:hypothetical protein